MVSEHYGGFVAYYRVSTAQQGKSGLGIEAQQAAVQSYLNGGRWNLVAEFTETESGIRTVINNFAFDGATKDPMQQAVRDALIGFMAATAQAQAEATKASQRAGIEHAKGRQDSPYLSRHSRGRNSPRFATCSGRARPISPKLPRPRECSVKPCTGSRRTRPRPKRR
jgi:DNA invertase Pin-like site-specific DNA recombinase